MQFTRSGEIGQTYTQMTHSSAHSVHLSAYQSFVLCPVEKKHVLASLLSDGAEL